jgi:hypothetical protein
LEKTGRAMPDFTTLSLKEAQIRTTPGHHGKLGKVKTWVKVL